MNKKLIAFFIIIALGVAAIGYYVSQAEASTCPTPAPTKTEAGQNQDVKSFKLWTYNEKVYNLLKSFGFNIELREKPNQQVPVPSKPQPAPIQGLNADEQRMFDLVNKERVANGLKPLEIDMRLVKTARLKSQDMVDLGYFDHNSPTYGSPFDMMKSYGITYSYAGENLAGAPDVDTAHVNLMNSPGHRANILRAEFTHVGIGVVEGSRYGKIFTQQFIRK